jgi:lipoprotein-anchoring transpeptidase ErfK/SrfK
MTRSRHIVRRFPGSRRGTFGFATSAVLAVIVSGFVSVPPASASRVPVGQALVMLSHAKTARRNPSINAPEITTVASQRPLTHVQTVLPVLGRATSKHGEGWVDVRLPGRPNGSSGWITTAGTMPSWTPWRLLVNLNARLVTVYYRGRITRRFPAVVGKPSTPTPTGQFFIEEGLSLNAQASGAPFALATSARSHVFQEFDGGPGQIAIHGMGNLPGALGTASSHGCVRLDTPDITWLAMRIGPGVPLRILQ